MTCWVSDLSGPEVGEADISEDGTLEDKVLKRDVPYDAATDEVAAVESETAIDENGGDKRVPVGEDVAEGGADEIPGGSDRAEVSSAGGGCPSVEIPTPHSPRIGGVVVCALSGGEPSGSVYLKCFVAGRVVELGRDEAGAEDPGDIAGADDVAGEADDVTELAAADVSGGSDSMGTSSVGGGDSSDARATASEPSSRAARMAARRMARRGRGGCGQECLSWRLGSSFNFGSGTECRLYIYR